MFANPAFFRALKNTLIYSSIKYVFLLLPPLFAILMNEISSRGYKRIVQTVTTLPHFISWVIIYGLCYALFSSEGPVNQILAYFGTSQKLLTNKNAVYGFQSALHLWKSLGWNAIIYLSAITAIDPTLYEAASIDGAGRWAKIKHITLPGIRPTIMILLLMNVGNVLNAGFEVQYLLGNGLIKSVSETIDIYVLTWGISQNDFSLGTAAGMFKSAVSIALIVLANWAAKKTGDDSLF